MSSTPVQETVKRTTLWIVILATVAVVVVLAVASRRPNPDPEASASPRAPASLGPTETAPGTPSGSVAATVIPPTGSTTSPTEPTAAILVGAGDIASCSSGGDEATAALLDGIEGTVFTLGDNAYERGTSAEYSDCYGPGWGRHEARTLPVAGNHDYETRGATGYYDYFGESAGDPTQGWYASDLGTWRVYVLNSNCASIGGCDAGSEQEQWLRADLAANRRDCVLAMWHHPLFSSGQHGNNTITRPLWEALYEANADLILTGHDHLYERFGPQTPAGAPDDLRGIVEFVVGTGGRSHYAFETIRANSLVRNRDTYGVLRLALAAGSYSFDFIPVAGQTFTDSGSGTCH